MLELTERISTLEQIVDNYQQLYDKSEKILALFDISLHVIYATPFSATIYNVDSKSLLGQHSDDFPLAPSAQKLRKKIYQEVIEQKKSKEFLSINRRRINGYTDLLFILKPIFNPANGSLIALELSGIRYSFPLLFKNKAAFRLFEDKNDLDIEFTNEVDANGCTTREVEILFLLFQTKNMDDIAEILTQVYGAPASTSTLYSVIRNKLYPKFNVHNLDDLAKVAHKLGYHKRLPVSLFHDLVMETSNL